MNETLRKIRSAYAIAGREQPAHYSPLPAWNELSIEVREAIIDVYHAGRRDAREEAHGGGRAAPHWPSLAARGA
jgi:hypothetical protein